LIQREPESRYRFAVWRVAVCTQDEILKKRVSMLRKVLKYQNVNIIVQSRKHRQYNGQTKKNKRQIIVTITLHKKNDCSTKTTLIKPDVNSDASKE
jgi:hypothetical protein